MKRYFIIGFLCLFSLHSIAEYYYYHGEKVNNTVSIKIYKSYFS